MPLYSTSVLLLDTAPAIPNVFVGGVVTVSIGVVGWLLNRAIGNSDANVRELKEVVTALTKLVGEIGTQQQASQQLTKYMEKRIETLEIKKETLEKAFTEMDKIIDREIIHRKPNS
ncbi:hypothetical protein [Hymenobacter sp. BT491]|uniref:hypothetical protein n=1 Tax=Hymenobacter sp. BT491 TaxID=2766779 RepID=UPI001653A78F|nr:hypothetical protein [Hymenobacter sp. BT491]